MIQQFLADNQDQTFENLCPYLCNPANSRADEAAVIMAVAEHPGPALSAELAGSLANLVSRRRIEEILGNLSSPDRGILAHSLDAPGHRFDIRVPLFRSYLTQKRPLARELDQLRCYLQRTGGDEL